MNAPLAFAFDTQVLRVVRGKDGEPWFVAADVCSALTIGNNRDALSRLDDDEKGVGSIDTLGGVQEVATVNESGLYSLILGSRKTEARRFKKWVTSEVLPSIRKTGGYGRAAAQEPVGAVSGLPSTKLISLQNQSWSLIQRLRAERDPELRRALYLQLAVVMGDLGQPAPALENIGRDAAAVPAAVEEFWKAYVQLEAKGVKLNHHRNPALIAVNLRHFVKAAAEHKLRVPLAKALRDCLRLSRTPRFVDARNVKSALLGTAVFCWVFEAEPEGGAQ